MAYTGFKEDKATVIKYTTNSNTKLAAQAILALAFFNGYETEDAAILTQVKSIDSVLAKAKQDAIDKFNAAQHTARQTKFNEWAQAGIAHEQALGLVGYENHVQLGIKCKAEMARLKQIFMELFPNGLPIPSH
jgi:hypothetical protein